MEIIVNHLTRIKGNAICIAGIAPDTHRHVRPVAAPGSSLTRDLLASHGGPVRVGSLIDIGEALPQPAPPHLEDHVVNVADIQWVKDLDWKEYTSNLEKVHTRNLREAFGEDLYRLSPRSLTLAKGSGKGSLAVLIEPARTLHVEIKANESVGTERVRLACQVAGRGANLSLTDVRLHDADGSVNRDRVNELRDAIKCSQSCYVMLGLGRAWSPDDGPRVHWLQANGIAPHS